MDDPTSGHLDLDALADVLAGEPRPAHLADCAACTQRLAELTAADALVLADLAALPLPEMPADLDARITAALAAERSAAARAASVSPVGSRTAATTVTPLVARRSLRWLPAAGGIAAAAVLVTGGVLLVQHAGSNSSSKSATTAAPAKLPAFATSESGTDYTRNNTTLSAQVRSLLAGASTPEAAGATPLSTTNGPSVGSGQRDAAKDLASLRSTQGLAACLASLSDSSDPGVPLALDYATFEGKPALVVVLPTTKQGKVDVFIVPPTCPAGGTLYEYARVTR